MRTWTDDIDPATIPDAVIIRERARRNARKRTTYTGGVYWKKHNAAVPACRCHKCMDRRERERE